MVQTMQRQSNQQTTSNQQSASNQGGGNQGGGHHPPAERFRFGNVSLTIFENQSTRDGQTQKFWKATIDKRYRDNQSGEWKSTNSYGVEDLLRLRAVLDRGINFMMEKPSE